MVQKCLGILSDSLPKPTMIPFPKNMQHPPFRPEPPDNTPFSVGVELSHEDLGDQTAALVSSSSPVFVRGIMYRAVNARSFVAHVRYNASAAVIAAAMGAPEQDVENLWLAGVRTPAKRSVDRRLLAPKDACMRFTPQSVLDCPIISSESEGVPAPSAEEACRESGLDRGQFADLFQEDKKLDRQCLEFGNALIEKLEAVAGASRAFPRYNPPTRRRNMRSRSLTSTSDGRRSAIVANSDGQKPDDGRMCGFSEKGSHVDVDVRCDGFAICKNGNGLYRTARGVSAMRPPRGPDDHESYYFEVVIVDDKDSGGICVGVGTESLSLNKLVGSNVESCGIHSSGQIVTNNGEFRQFGKRFKNGDRVGCMVKLYGKIQTEDPQTPLQSENGSYSELCDGLAALTKQGEEEVELTFFVNGEKQGTAREALWRDVPEDERKLFPVVSLYKNESKAVMQCCAKDWGMKDDELHRTVKAICCNRP